MTPDQQIMWLFRNLVQFFALDCQEQAKFVPDTFVFQHIEVGEFNLHTNRPLEVLSYQLQTYAVYPAMHEGQEGYEGINSELCEEINSLVELINEHLTRLEETDDAVWSTANLELPHWRLMRRMARTMLAAHDWELQTPKLTWEELCELVRW